MSTSKVAMISVASVIGASWLAQKLRIRLPRPF